MTVGVQVLRCIVTATGNYITPHHGWFGPRLTCKTAERSGKSSSCDPVDVPLTAGQILRAALISDRDADGYVRDAECQRWNLISTQGQVRVTLLHTNMPYRQMYTYSVTHGPEILEINFKKLILLYFWTASSRRHSDSLDMKQKLK